jgi:hypothetical protein
MATLEIPVIGDKSSAKEQFFKLLADGEIREMNDIRYGIIPLSEDDELLLYFFDQNELDQFATWELILPHSPGCIVVCNLDKPEILKNNINTIEWLEKKSPVPLLLCAEAEMDELPEAFSREEFQFGDQRALHVFNPNNRETVKTILNELIVEAVKSS